MKLNLLPTTVSKGKQAKSAVIYSVLIALAGVVIGGYLSVSSQHQLDDARTARDATVQPAQEAYQKSVDADTIIASDNSVTLIKDANLAKAMIDHNDVYPDLYESVKPYIPAFYRINSLSAQSAGDNAIITMVGTIDTYQQYAELMLAFARYPGVISVGRAGFVDRSTIVPNISTIDTQGKPRREDEAPIPDDKLARLAYFQSTVQATGYTGESNFGTGTDSTRGAMPTSSLVTVTLTVKKNLQVPDPRATLSGGGGAGTAATFGGPPAGGPAGGFGGGASPAGAGGGDAPATGAGKKGKAGKDDSGD